MFQKLIVLYFFLIGSIPLFSQSSILTKYVTLALEQNFDIQNATSVDLATTYLIAKGGRTLNFPVGDLFNPVYGTLNELTGNQQFPTDLENLDIQLTPNNFLDAQLVVQQPIFFSALKYNHKIQQELLKISDLDIDLTKQEVSFQVKTAYYNYLKSLEGIRILDESETLLQEVLAFNKKLVKFDKVTDEIIYDVEFQLANLASQKASLDEQSTLAKSLFNLLLNRKLDATIQIDKDILENLELETASLNSLKSAALNKRLEFKKLDVAENTNALNQELIKKEALPTVGVQGGIGVQTENFDFNSDGPLFTLGLGLNMNIFDNGQRKKQVEELAVERNILQNNREQLKQKVKIETVQAYYALESLRSKMEAEAAAETSAQKSYDRFRVRYENSRALLIQLLQAQNQLTTSQLQRALTRYDYLIKKAELTKILGM